MDKLSKVYVNEPIKIIKQDPRYNHDKPQAVREGIKFPAPERLKNMMINAGVW